jgi:hypothetical protein
MPSAQKREREKYLNQDETLQRHLTSGSKITEQLALVPSSTL